MLKVFYLTVLFFIIIILNLTKMWLTRLVSSFTRKEEYTHASFSFFFLTHLHKHVLSDIHIPLMHIS